MRLPCLSATASIAGSTIYTQSPKALLGWSMQLGGVLNAFAASSACHDVDLSPELCNRLQSLRNGRPGTDHHSMFQYNA